MDTKHAFEVPHLLVLTVLASRVREKMGAAASTLMGVTREESKLDPHQQSRNT